VRGGESLEDAVKRTDFEEAWDVLQAMQEQDIPICPGINFLLPGNDR
jgi:hypothetical protein